MEIKLLHGIDHYGNAYAPWGVYAGKDSIMLSTLRELGFVKINDVVAAYARNDGYIDVIEFSK